MRMARTMYLPCITMYLQCITMYLLCICMYLYVFDSESDANYFPRLSPYRPPDRAQIDLIWARSGERVGIGVEIENFQTHATTW